MNKALKHSLTYITAAILLVACAHKNTNTTPATPTTTPTLTASTPVLGYNLLSKICGIWNGPVTSTTPLGSYPQWIVDFRPISGWQVSAKNELDTLNSIFMSFFICYNNSQFKLAFRNGGTFTGLQRVAYMACDSVSETGTQSYYQFSDFVQGKKRDIVDVLFRNDSLYLTAYTNKQNTQSTATIHMSWSAKLQDTTSCQNAKTACSFPQKSGFEDFSTTFATAAEAVYYANSGDPAGDPYTESQQPYLGQSTLSYTVSSSYTLNSSNHVFLIVTTQPLISGTGVNMANLIYRSRYVILSASSKSYVFNYMHPGTYYLYAVYDANSDGTMDSGDYVSTTNTTFTLSPKGTASATTQINFTIP
ncbi:MAG TPA: hypothetical protein VK783_14245 [Bacteroidia bacterium]|jgi:hypothetical protein|nr:hypothetical protein [Bacteroidia bacterium]